MGVLLKINSTRKELKSYWRNYDKVGDKVRVVVSDEIYGLYKGMVHTVTSVHKMGNIELMGIDVIQWSPDRFELVQENTTTTQATAKRKDDDPFTPDCLVGVETNSGILLLFLVLVSALQNTLTHLFMFTLLRAYLKKI